MRNNTSNILSIGTATPAHKVPQERAAEFMAGTLNGEKSRERVLSRLYAATGISERYSVIPDYRNGQERDLYPNTSDLEPFPATKERMTKYRETALPLAAEATIRCLKQANISAAEIDHLVVVSCTGMYSPGIDIGLIEELGMKTQVVRTAIQFMGCHAAINALRIADAYTVSHPGSKTMVVCTELCSLHFQKKTGRDAFVSNAIFGDGAAAILVGEKSKRALSVSCVDFLSEILPDQGQHMAWEIGNSGFEMKLTSEVPELIRQNICGFVDEFLSRNELKRSDLAYYAIHPGGTRIIEACEKELSLDKEQVGFSYQVLKNYGNMSSPTILFVLEEIIKAITSEDKGKYILCLAFGPGLTIESTLLKIDNV